jgi:hypothetical protein
MSSPGAEAARHSVSLRNGFKHFVLNHADLRGLLLVSATFEERQIRRRVIDLALALKGGQSRKAYQTSTMP